MAKTGLQDPMVPTSSSTVPKGTSNKEADAQVDSLKRFDSNTQEVDAFFDAES